VLAQVLRHGIVGREPLVRVVVAVEAAAVLADVEDARDDAGPVQIARHLLANVRLAARRQANHHWGMAGTRRGQAFRGRGKEAGGDPVGHAVPTTILLSPRGSGGFSGILAELRWSTDARRIGMEGLEGLGGLTTRKNMDVAMPCQLAQEVCSTCTCRSRCSLVRGVDRLHGLFASATS